MVMLLLGGRLNPLLFWLIADEHCDVKATLRPLSTTERAKSSWRLCGALRVCVKPNIRIRVFSRKDAKPRKDAKISQFAKHSALLENTRAFISFSIRERNSNGLE
jgi:hypothetical protein